MEFSKRPIPFGTFLYAFVNISIDFNLFIFVAGRGAATQRCVMAGR